jgi:hypothetical protein
MHRMMAPMTNRILLVLLNTRDDDSARSAQQRTFYDLSKN